MKHNYIYIFILFSLCFLSFGCFDDEVEIISDQEPSQNPPPEETFQGESSIPDVTQIKSSDLQFAVAIAQNVRTYEKPDIHSNALQ